MILARLIRYVQQLGLSSPPSMQLVTTGPADSMGWQRVLAQGSEEGSDEPETVRARRRRRTESDSQERQRAEAPRRRRPPAQPAARESRPSGLSQSSGGQTSPATSLLPLLLKLLSSGGAPRWLIIGIVVILGIWMVYSFMSGPQDTSEYLYEYPTTEPYVAETTAPRATTRPFVPPSVSAEGPVWLVMLYQDADDKILEQDIYVDLNEAERVGSGERVHIVAQVDRFRAGYQGDGNWSTTRRFYVTQDNDLQRVGSQQVADLGEVNMSDGAALVDFVTWAVETFPADRYALILSDHGMGWPGGWSDPAPGGPGDRSIPLAAAMGDELYLMELDAALEEIRSRTGLVQFELIGMDACLMGHVEVLSALQPHARYAVTSQETEPALGWAYTGFLAALRSNPDMDGAELGRWIVDTYIQEDQRIVDDEARAEFLRQGSPLAGLFGLFGPVSSEQLAQQMEQNITLAAVDLEAVPDLLDSLNEFSFALQGDRQADVARARTYAQSFTSVFGNNVPPSYVDLGNLVQQVQQSSSNRDVQEAAEQLLSALDRAVVAERHGSGKPGATGVSIYFPNSQLYGSPVTGPESYTAIAQRFAQESLWDEFLAYHYAGRRFEQADRTIVVPEPGSTTRGPGSGQIELSAIDLSDDVATPGRPVLLGADIRGENVGYVQFFAGFYDQEANSIFVADVDYLESATTREIDGVYYPEWPEGDQFRIEFEWEPVVFAINDGQNSQIALLTPERYGASPEEAVYTVEGIYTYADGGESRYARLYFQDGALRHVFGFTQADGTGAPREIVPEYGDRFTILERWMDLDASGSVAQLATQEGGTLTFAEQTFTWEELDAAAGAYIVGLIVQDLDGNAYEIYARLIVE